MKSVIHIAAAMLLTLASIQTATAEVISSKSVIMKEQRLYNKQQLIALVDSQAVQQQLISMGVDVSDAKRRIANMTDSELAEFHHQLEELPAGQGIAGTIVTVLLVIAVLDLLGVTDVYPFIRPINR